MAYFIRYFRKEKGDWSRNSSRNCLWDRYWGPDGQLLANFFPCREKQSQSQKSLGNLIRPSFLSRSKVANEVNFTLFTRLCLSRLIEVTNESSSGNKWNLQTPQLIVRVSCQFKTCALRTYVTQQEQEQEQMMRTVFPPYYCHARAILALVSG